MGGTNVTFSITAGSVGGLSLGSASASPATYSGTASSTGTTNVTFRVTDNVTGTTADRTFSIVATDPPLFTWNGANETIRTKVGFGLSYSPTVGPWVGPTLSELRSLYAPASTGAWENNPSYFDVRNGGIQVWTVPDSGTWRIKAYGAAGGSDNAQNATRSPGGIVQGDVSLSKGQKLLMAVGNTGAYNANRGSNPGFDGAGNPSYQGAVAVLYSNPEFLLRGPPMPCT